MKILKLLALGLLGYALYEGYRYLYGRLNEPEKKTGRHRTLETALNSEQGRMSVLTGPAHDQNEGGKVVSTVNRDGASSPTIVGRGVIHR